MRLSTDIFKYFFSILQNLQTNLIYWYITKHHEKSLCEIYFPNSERILAILRYWLCFDKLLKIVDIKCECNTLRIYTGNNNLLEPGIAQIGTLALFKNQIILKIISLNQ